MKNILKRILIIFIILVTLVEIILPPSIFKNHTIVYADDSEKGFKNFTPKKTCWYTWDMIKTSKLDNIYDIYYIDQDGNKIKPSQRKKNWHTRKQVYLITGITYKVPEGLELKEADQTLTETLEGMVSLWIYSIANGLHYLLSAALGKTITIDDLVFNNYAETNISYFDTKSEVGDEMASSLIYGTNGVGGLDTVVNAWYKIFRRIALMGYMVILVYMGIRILLGATAEKRANYKELFMHWVVGIAILLLFPYVMAYIIKINVAMVKIIEENKDFNSSSTTVASAEIHDFEKISIDDEIDWGTGTDYMSQLGYAAYQMNKVTLSFAFLIATWQLLVLVFHYYKRLFVIAFLIIIFPLVALSYAVDKIADGKSQALNTWIKEYIINVFVQTFHAIIYSFVCATIYSASGNSSEVGTVNNYDFILVLVGITFLFKGEEIIKKIFGQESKAGTMKSLTQSAAGTFAKIKTAEKLAKTANDFAFGNKGVIKKTIGAGKNLWNISKDISNFDKRATSQEEFNIGARLEGAPTPPAQNASAEEFKEYRRNMEAFNAVAVLNNPNSHSYEEKARAEAILKRLAMENPEHEAFKSSKISVSQFQALADLDRTYNRMIVNGNNSFEIEQEITARMAMIFPSDDEKQIKERTNIYFTEKFYGGGNSFSRLGLKNEVDKTIQIIENERIKTKYGYDFNRDENSIKKYIGEIEKMYITDDSTGIADGFTDDQKEEVKSLAKSIYILKQRKNGGYTQKEILKALDDVRKHGDDNEITKQLVEDLYDEDLDIDTLSHTVAKDVIKSRREVERVYQKYMSDIEKSFAEDDKGMSADEIDDYKSFARNIFIVSNRDTGVYSSDEVLKATKEVKEHANDNSQTIELLDKTLVVTEEYNIEELYDLLDKRYSKDSNAKTESEEALKLAEDIVKDYEDNPRDGFYDDELSSHEIIKNMDDEDSIEQMIDTVFNARKEAVNDVSKQIAEDILAERKVDVLKGSLDTKEKTYNGYTKNEYLALRISELGNALDDLSPFKFKGENANLLDHYAIHMLEKKEKERTGITENFNKKRNFSTTTKQYVENRKKERQKIENAHFMGDVESKK